VSRRAIPIAFVGLHFGLFGLILTLSSTEVARLGASAFGFAALLWAIGLGVLVVAILEANHPD